MSVLRTQHLEESSVKKAKGVAAALCLFATLFLLISNVRHINAIVLFAAYEGDAPGQIGLRLGQQSISFDCLEAGSSQAVRVEAEQVTTLALAPEKAGSYTIYGLGFYADSQLLGYLSAEELFHASSYAEDMQAWDLTESGQLTFVVKEQRSANRFITYAPVDALRDEFRTSLLLGSLLASLSLTAMVLAAYVIYCRHRTHKRVARIEFALFMALMTALTSFLCRDYLFYGMRFISSTTYDSWYQTVPFLRGHSLMYAKYGALPQWSMNCFLGMPSALTIGNQLNFINDWICLFGPEHVIPLMGLSQALKILLSGMFFYLYLRKLNRSWPSCIVFSLCYALCGTMVIRSSYASYPSEVLCAAMLLYGFECFFANRRHLFLLPLAVCLMTLCRGYYAGIFYGGVLLAYAVFRECVERRFSFSRVLRLLLPLGALYAIGIAMAAQYLLPSLQQTLSSSRLIAVTQSSMDLTTLSSAETLGAVYLRLVSNTILRTLTPGSNTPESLDIIYGPAFYSGVVTLLMLTPAFMRATRKERTWYALMLGIAALLCLFKEVRIRISGDEDTFKMAFFWVTVVLLYIASKGLDALLSAPTERLIVPTVVSAAVWLVPLFLLGIFHGELLQDAQSVLFLHAMLLALAAGLLLLRKHPRLLAVYLVCVTLLDVSMNANAYLNQASALNDQDCVSVYSRELGAALDRLAEEDTDIYRIDNSTLGTSRCIPQYYNFMATTANFGGTAFSNTQVDFLRSVLSDETLVGEPFRAVAGFPTNNVLNTFLGVKYRIDEEGGQFLLPYGYRRNEALSTEKYAVSENMLALPLFYTHDRLMSRAQYDGLTAAERPWAMLQAMVLEDHPDVSSIDAMPLPGQTIVAGTTAIVAQNRLDVTLAKTEKPYLLLQMRGQTDTGRDSNYNYVNFLFYGQAQDTEQPKRFFYSSFADGSLPIRFVVPNEGFQAIILTMAGIQADYVEVYSLDESDLLALARIVDARKATPVAVDVFTDERIVLRVDAEQAQYLFTPITYNTNWRATLDGQPADILQANLCFMAMQLPPGAHTVELVYNSPLILVGKWTMHAGWIVWLLASGTALFAQEHKKRRDRHEKRPER